MFADAHVEAVHTILFAPTQLESAPDSRVSLLMMHEAFLPARRQARTL